MSLTMRKTGSALLAYQQWADYTIYDDGRAIGRIYEDRATRPGLRWFWSITMVGARNADIRTDGCAPHARTGQSGARRELAEVMMGGQNCLRVPGTEPALRLFVS
jgi:hypothetical protein